MRSKKLDPHLTLGISSPNPASVIELFEQTKTFSWNLFFSLILLVFSVFLCTYKRIFPKRFVLLKSPFLTILIFGLVGCSDLETHSVAKDAPCAEGTTRHGYLNAMTNGDMTCPEATQFCISGKWSGPTLFPTCTNMTKNCGGSPHGSVVSGYAQPTSPHGIPCTMATKTCIDGAWIGPEVFPSCSEM